MNVNIRQISNHLTKYERLQYFLISIPFYPIPNVNNTTTTTTTKTTPCLQIKYDKRSEEIATVAAIAIAK
jgi:hypothetical protein